VITREELREELAAHPTRNELREALAAHPTRNELREALAAYPTRDELRLALAAYPTRDELMGALAAYATRDELRAEYMSRAELERAFERFATKADLNEFREETAQSFSDLRRYMEILVEDLKAWTKTLFEGTTVRGEAAERRLTAKDDEQDQRLDDLDGRVARLESRPRRTPK
jgi:hypothetical protein